MNLRHGKKTSQYLGVSLHRRNKTWKAAIRHGEKVIYIGSFFSEERAARAYDEAALRYRGNKAKLNFKLTA